MKTYAVHVCKAGQQNWMMSSFHATPKKAAKAAQKFLGLGYAAKVVVQ